MNWMAVTSKRRRRTIVWAVLGALLVALVTMAVAQPGQRGDTGGRTFGGRGGGGQGFGMGMRGMPGMMAAPAIAVAGDAVFVVRANMIYKFDADTLELLAQAEIPEPETSPAPAGQ